MNEWENLTFPPDKAFWLIPNTYLKELTDLIQHIYWAPTYTRFHVEYKDKGKHMPLKSLQSTWGDKTHI